MIRYYGCDAHKRYSMFVAMERAGHEPQLANAGKARLMMGQINKTDKLDAQGLAT